VNVDRNIAARNKCDKHRNSLAQTTADIRSGLQSLCSTLYARSRVCRYGVPTFQREILPLTSRKIFPKMGNILSFKTLAPTCLITLSRDREEHDTSVAFRLTTTFSLCRRRGATLEQKRNIDWTQNTSFEIPCNS